MTRSAALIDSFLFIGVFLVLTSAVSAQQCNGLPAAHINLYWRSTESLESPDQRWEFTSTGPKSSNKPAALTIRNLENSRSWNVGAIERNGTAFWSDDSKRLFLRDEYAADDTKIRVFDVSGLAPKELQRLNSKIRRAIYAQVPSNKTTMWLHFPEVCFAPQDSSTIFLTADAPLAPKKGSGPGKDFSMKMQVHLDTLKIVTAVGH